MMEDAITASAKTGVDSSAALVDMAFMNALVEHSPEPMLLLEPDGTILYVNQAVCSLTGRSKEELLTFGRALLIDPQDPRWRLSFLEREQTGQSMAELNMLHQDGSRIPVEVKSRAFVNSANKTLTSVHVRDLRTYYKTKQKIAEQQQDLQNAFKDLELVLEHSADMICTFDQKGTILQINNACRQILGYTAQEMIGKNYTEFIHPEDVPITIDDTRQVQEQNITNNFRNRYLHKNGSTVYLSWSSSLLKEVGKIYCIARNITERIQIEQKHHENETKMEALLQEGYDLVCIIDRNGVYSYVSGSLRNVLGYEPQDLVGFNAFSFIHPEDLPAVQQQFEKVLLGMESQTPPFRFKTKCGEWRWVETKGVNCFHIPSINGIIINSRDISERLAYQHQLELNEKKYKALFENNPDCVYSLNTEGFFTSVNAATVAKSGYTEEQLLQMNFVELLHPDWLEVAIQEFHKCLAGDSRTSELIVLNAKGQEIHLAITKVPVVVNGQLLGVHGIAKDITLNKKQQKLLSQTASRLNNILESIKDGFFTLDKAWCFTYVNHQFEKAMHVDGEELYGRDIRNLYPKDQYEVFYQQFDLALQEKRPIQFEAFVAVLGMWLDVSVYPSHEGLSVYIKGINARKAVEAELKKLSLVASKTVNSVYITDEEACIEWVNDGFTRISGYTLEEVKGRKPGDFLAGPSTNREKVSAIRQKLTFDQPFVQEVQNRNRFGEIYWSKLDVTPIIDEHSGGAKKFIVIETVITDQKIAEEERIKLTDELLRRNHHLQQFTYIVSHNLRSPVANILGLTSLLSSGGNVDMQKGLTDRLKLTAQNLDAIIRDLNDLLSLQGGLLEARDKVSLATVVDQALQGLPADSIQEVQVELNGIDEIDSVRSYVSSIVSNLLSNAVKYKSLDRPLQIKITAHWTEENRQLCLAVTDNGLGINLEKEGKNLFGLYKRFHFHVAGRGLGLYLVKTQAEAMGGSVRVESTPGAGSTFYVCLQTAL
ncbi:PAS domain-containing sensor histidine kinase [Rufibacter sp. LB8]|uniref:PAS domain-containing sensor histidine kinase n=1 Tax=Rufibacter sp. LB8 TaxID=2777781 RepID=UPI00178C2F10|nr:PAS domain-containing sensor histidine kinase [Rufibacter sp. LB8]